MNKFSLTVSRALREVRNLLNPQLHDRQNGITAAMTQVKLGSVRFTLVKLYNVNFTLSSRVILPEFSYLIMHLVH